MKKVIGMSVALMALIVAPVTRAGVVFSDDGSAGTVGGDPTAVIGTWEDASGEVTDTATAGISDSPGGGNFIGISRGMGGAGLLVGWATAIGNAATPLVHYEFDMYVVGNGAGTTYADWELLESADAVGVGYPLAGTAIQLRVSDNVAVYPNLDVRNMYTDPPGSWTLDALGPTVVADAWHHYELDYTIGDTTSMTLTVDGGTGVNVPAPWSWDGYGSATELDEVSGVMFRPAGGAQTYYLDDLSLSVAVPEPATGLLLLSGGLVMFLRRRRLQG
jgi:hypothetical protein